MLVRVAAAKVIAKVTGDGASLSSCLPEFSQKVPDRDQALLSELCYGTLRQYFAIGKVIDTLLDKPLKPKDRDISALLACALYQLTHTHIPSHAVVNESVAACKQLKRPWAKGLINALLRRFIRDQQVIEQDLANQPEYASAHPQWLIDALHKAWPEDAQAIMAANNGRAPMTLRVNELRSSRDEYLISHCSDTSARATATKFSMSGVQLVKAKAVNEIPGFDQGMVSVQDEAAQLAASLLDLRAGYRVLDACCAPGGKTCHILESAPDAGAVIAIDIDARRLDRVRENLDRLQLSVELLSADVQNPDSWWDGKCFDRILLDAPCSATGVIRRHPDIKLLRKPEDIAKLTALQQAMLARLWPLLKVGGKLLYATCSILPQENDEVIERFLDSVNNAELHPVATDAGRRTKFGRQLFPQQGGHDGFYYALLEKL